MKKRIGCLLTTLCLAAAMSGCSRKPGEEQKPAETLPPATVGWEAPDGDRSVREAEDCLVYVPEKDEQKLAAHSIRVEEADLKSTATALARKVLAEVNGNQVFRNVREIELYRDAPIEISRGICTVTLSSAALQLSYSDYYKLALALSTTLCGMDEIKYVNVLTAGQSVALDSAGRLPMGSLAGHPDENLNVLWEQMEAKRTPQGGDPSRSPLNTQATVYYPLADGRGTACESRRVTFAGQTTSQLASTMLDMISDAVRSRTGGGNIPDLFEYMVHEPVSSEMEEGGKLVTLSFREDIQELADAWETDIPCIAAAVTLTLTTFVPGVSAVCFRVADKPVTEISSSRFRIGTILGGLMRRGTFGIFLTGSTEVYFELDGTLVRTEKPVDLETADSPRVQMNALMQGPDRADAARGITSPLPQDAREDDLLGIAAAGDVLLVNFSGGFREKIAALGAEKEMLLCYAIVNTLCENTGRKRVCFFFEGEQAEWIAGEVYWAGEFMYNPQI